ncbi:MAG: branched-chain amino acid ABC transporter permease [bacterium]
MRYLGSILVWLSGAALLALGLFFLGPYGSLIVWSLCQQVILALSYSFIGGMGGEIHLGHGAFFGLGAYSSAIFLQAGQPWWLALFMAWASGMLMCVMTAPFLVKMRGADFAVGSFCLALFLNTLARNLQEFTGGTAGISVSMLSKEIPYVCTLVLLGVTLWTHQKLMGSGWGRSLRAVGMDPLAARHLGINDESLRTQALLLGSALASWAGGIYPLQSGYVSPDSALGTEVLLTPVVSVLLGGSRSTWGPVLGAATIFLAQELILTRFQGWTLLAFGLIIATTGFHVSEGLDSWLDSKILRYFRHSRADAS